MLAGSRRPKQKRKSSLSVKCRPRAKEDPREFAMLQPWFLSLEIAGAVKTLIPPRYLSRTLWVFEDYGCFRCGGKTVPYGGNGFCRDCRWEFVRRMVASMRKRYGTPEAFWDRKPKARLIDTGLLARKILADLMSAPSTEAPQDNGHDKKSHSCYSPWMRQKNKAGSLWRKRVVPPMGLSQIMVIEE